jgi:hypothetical protein
VLAGLGIEPEANKALVPRSKKHYNNRLIKMIHMANGFIRREIKIFWRRAYAEIPV